MKNLYFILFFLILMPSICYSVDSTTISSLEKFYGELKGFNADFTQILEHKESGSREIRQGKLSFKKPLLIRWQTTPPHEETLVVSEKEIWDYLPEEKIAYRYNPEIVQDSRSIIQVLTGQAPLAKDFDIKDGGLDKGNQKLILYPHEPVPSMVEATLWVNPQNGQIQRTRITDFYGNINDVSLSNFKSNPRFGSTEFNYQPPKGVEIEDRIDHGVEEKELFK